VGAVHVEEAHRLAACADFLDRVWRECRPNALQERPGVLAVLPIEDTVLVVELGEHVDIVTGRTMVPGRPSR